MEGYISIYSPVFLSEKPPAVKSPMNPATSMRSILTGTDDVTQQPLDQAQRNQFITYQSQYIVVEVAHYKVEDILPELQHEYIIFHIQDSHAPSQTPVVIKLSRTVQGDSLLARLGIYGRADDSVTDLSTNDQANLPDRLVHRLSWTTNLDRAPSLAYVSALVASVHDNMPRYCLFKMSCYSFALAIVIAIHRAYDGSQQPGILNFLIQRSHFLGIPTSHRRAQRIGEVVASVHTTTRDVVEVAAAAAPVAPLVT